MKRIPCWETRIVVVFQGFLPGLDHAGRFCKYTQLILIRSFILQLYLSFSGMSILLLPSPWAIGYSFFVEPVAHRGGWSCNGQSASSSESEHSTRLYFNFWHHHVFDEPPNIWLAVPQRANAELPILMERSACRCRLSSRCCHAQSTQPLKIILLL